ncbi:hypothetical protein ACVWW1_000073 [Bradyrhizobium sp. JR3.5]
MAGTYRRLLTLTSGRFAMIDNGLGFQLVPWSRELEKRLGQHVTGVVKDGGGIEWRRTCHHDNLVHRRKLHDLARGQKRPRRLLARDHQVANSPAERVSIRPGRAHTATIAPTA